MAIALAGGGLVYQQVVVDSGACEFPDCFPDASNTGVPAGTSLSAYSGANPITANDTVVDGKIITSCPLVIQATGVIIRNSQFDCTASDAIYIDDAGQYAESNNGADPVVTIEDVDIDCGGTFAAGPTAVWEAHFVLRRAEIVNCENGASLNQNVLIEDSFIHDLDNDGADPHDDGIQLAGGHWNGSSYPCCSLNIEIRHNTIWGMANGDTDFATSAIISNSSFDTNTLIVNNLMAGGGVVIYCARTGNSVAENYQLIDNAFSKQFHANYGLVGIDDDCGDETTSGNIDVDTGSSVEGLFSG